MYKVKSNFFQSQSWDKQIDLWVCMQKISKLSVCGNGNMCTLMQSFSSSQDWISISYFAFERRNKFFFHHFKQIHAIRDLSTESKQFAESNGNLFSKLKVEANKLICGFTCKRYVTCIPFLVCKSSHRVHYHFSTAGKFHHDFVWKKLLQNKWFASTKKYFIDSFPACLCKNHLASKLLKSFFKSKKKGMFTVDTASNHRILLQILFEKKHVPSQPKWS